MAAIGGLQALNSVQNLCAIGQVKISASEFHQGDESVKARNKEETGGFVLWQKHPNLWSLELLVSGCKVISGSNGKISWRQSSNQLRPMTKGPPRPLRRFLQVTGYTINLQSNSYRMVMKNFKMYKKWQSKLGNK